MSEELTREIAALKKERNAVVLAHTYQRGEVQDCADFVGDSYGLSVAARKAEAETIVFCGVRFMAETAAILNPSRTVVLPEPQAGCPMADMITPGELLELKARHPRHLVLCYVNSTAEIKALSDVCCTSSNAEQIARRLPEGRGIVFVPDQHLGSWVRERTGREMVLWNGLCPTHLRVTPEDVRAARRAHPGADVLIHPEVPHECRVLADAVLSTGGMCDYAAASGKEEFVVATETGILHTLRKQNPGKRFFAATEGALCPNMKRGTLRSLRDALAGTGGAKVEVEPEIAARARHALEEMLRLGA